MPRKIYIKMIRALVRENFLDRKYINGLMQSILSWAEIPVWNYPAPPFRVQRNRVAEVEDDYGTNPTHEQRETRSMIRLE
jgi:hypothetical protein